MPHYEYRCNNCSKRFVVSYKTFQDYDVASPQCLDCASADLTRVITQVAIGKSNRDYSKMSSNEMLSVLEAGDKQQVDKLFRQVGDTSLQKPPPSADETNHDDASRRDRPRETGNDAKNRPDSG